LHDASYRNKDPLKQLTEKLEHPEPKKKTTTGRAIEIGMNNLSLSAVDIAKDIVATGDLYYSSNRVSICRVDIILEDGNEITRYIVLDEQD
jgi:hypothetical protein